jgi:hypothetical protein
VGGTLVEHRVCVASSDWLAADRVAVELMGIDYAKVGYLNYCAKGGLGEGDLQNFKVVGEPIVAHVRRYPKGGLKASRRQLVERKTKTVVAFGQPSDFFLQPAAIRIERPTKAYSRLAFIVGRTFVCYRGWRSHTWKSEYPGHE